STRNITGISSNRWTCLFILVGSGNLYPLLHGSVVVSVVMPNASLEVNNKHNLELSICQNALFASGFLDVILIF
ncbi:MAG: hypothetical protein KAI39_02735, partial [Desulfobulbaceae bacterium]|nr:hypothetical protein [Desulfobulbaceae bacterium]